MNNEKASATINTNEKENITMNAKEITKARFESLLEEYGYDYEVDAIDNIVEHSFDQKENLHDILSQSQYWDEDEQMIVLRNKTILRSFNTEGINKFFEWAYNMLEQRVGISTGIPTIFSRIYQAMKWSFEEGYGNLINLEALKDYFANFFDVIEDKDKIAKEIDRLLNNDVKPLVNGQKWSRYIGSFCKAVGLDKIVDIRTEIYTNPTTGEVTKRQKDMGYNYHFALLADSINPLEIKGKTFVISLNLIDYLTMSFGTNWASCHTIDKNNARGCHGHYNGEWSSGTLSYALDDVAIIAYIVDEENAPKEDRNEHHKYGKDVPYCLRDKEHREVVAWQNDKLYFGRVYPDGRDGGEEGIAAQFREIIQQIFAECLDTSNLWTTKKGVCEVPTYVHGNREGFTAYDDWKHYDDCAVSFLRRIDGILNEEPIIIGALPICPKCGEQHDHQESIHCYDCDNGAVRCARCGARIDLDYGYERIGDSYYCDSECAEADGYVWTIDDEWILEENAIYIEDNCSYYPDGDDRIVLCDGDDDDWHLKENCHKDAYDGLWYSPHYTDGVTAYNDDWYSSEANAINDGLVYCDDDNYWHHVG